MHFIGLALEPAKKASHAIPAIVFVIVVGVVSPSFFTFDHEILVCRGQFLERHVDVDLFASAGAQQILLRFAKLRAPKDAYHALLNA